MANPKFLIKPKTPKIDWAHPITKGLQMDWLLSEGGGNNYRDIVTRSKGVLSSGVLWVKGQGGEGLSFDAGGEYAMTVNNLPALQQFSRYLTIEIEFVRTGGGAGTVYGTLCGMGSGGTFGDRMWLLENDNGDGGWGQTFQIWWNSQPGIWSMDYPANGKLHHWVIIYDGGSTSNDPIFVLNGRKDPPGFQERLSPSGSLRTGGTRFVIGNHNGLDGTWNGGVFRVRVWKRMLTVAEAVSLYKNPYQIYQNTRIMGKAPSASASHIKKVSGNTLANIKVLEGTAIAGVKKFMGELK